MARDPERTTTPTTPSRRTVTSECVADGHPDKLCDQIADAVVDACLAQDPASRVALEVAFKDHDLWLFGEITTAAEVDLERVALDTLREVCPDYAAFGLDLDRLAVRTTVSSQSGNIATLVGQGGDDPGAGDQGMAYGYACDETDVLMPLAYQLSRALMLRHREVRLASPAPILGPDAKAQVTVSYDGDRPVAVEKVVLSSQHREGTDFEAVRDLLMEDVVRTVIPAELMPGDDRILLNRDAFIEGGPVADAGVTGRKIVVDAYGGGVPVGGGAFSGKDPTKVDRSGAYMARAVARDIVAAGLARRALVHAAWAIGKPEPLAVEVDTFGTGEGSDAALALRYAPYFRPGTMIRTLGLSRPLYRATAAFGHFGRPGFPWEKPLPVAAPKLVVTEALDA